MQLLKMNIDVIVGNANKNLNWNIYYQILKN